MELARILCLLLLSLGAVSASAQEPLSQGPVAFSKADLGRKFLLQISYEQENGWERGGGRSD